MERVDWRRRRYLLSTSSPSAASYFVVIVVAAAVVFFFCFCFCIYLFFEVCREKGCKILSLLVAVRSINNQTNNHDVLRYNMSLFAYAHSAHARSHAEYNSLAAVWGGAAPIIGRT